MEAQVNKHIESWIYADAIIGVSIIVLQIDKLRQTEQTNPALFSPRSVRASRLILDTIVKLHDVTLHSKIYAALYTYCISFYPFRAFFVLYYHILACKDPDLCKEDVTRLEKMDMIMKQAARTRFEYVPISSATSSLNKITKYLQQTQMTSQRQLWTKSECLSHQTAFDELPGTHNTAAYQVPDWEGVINSFDTQQPSQTMQWLPNFGNLQLPTASNFAEVVSQPGFEPVEYMQAFESQFSGGDWAYAWWNVEDPSSLPVTSV
jgi:hypothetical protein